MSLLQINNIFVIKNSNFDKQIIDKKFGDIKKYVNNIKTTPLGFFNIRKSFSDIKK